jgi:TonB family protein
MSKPKVIVGAIIVLVMVLAAARTSAAGPSQAQQPGGMSREPIRVGGNVQESKLVQRVEPIYPDQAKDARISGVVILQVTVDEQGNVSDIRVMRGHPLLQNAAVEAVRQWRYSPTLLNGEAVPVIATVTVPFTAGRNEVSAILDESGIVHAPALQLDGEALIRKVRESKQGLRITASVKLPLRLIEEYVRELQNNGIPEVQVSGFTYREGRLFQSFAIGSPGAPEVALDLSRLSSIAGEAGPAPDAGQGPVRISYRLFINEVGEIVGLDQAYGPKIPVLESELLHAKVVTPGRRGADTVPAALTVTVFGAVVPR